MLRTLISHPGVATAVTQRGETLAQLLSLPEFTANYSVTQRQVHRATCTIIDGRSRLTAPPESDALVTTLSGVTLVVQHADCLPILIFHPRGLIGAVHAGRKGTRELVLKKTLKLMQQQFGIRENLQIWFGPALCRDCHTYAEYTKKYDLISENKAQLESIFDQTQAHLSIDGNCTLHQSELFHSYRGDGGGTQNWSAISLQ
jgi:copper oxidase (laccase) domain-containing protein